MRSGERVRALAWVLLEGGGESGSGCVFGGWRWVAHAVVLARMGSVRRGVRALVVSADVLVKVR